MNFKDIEKLCLEKDIKLTSKRVDIVKSIVEINSKEGHPDVEEIYDHVKKINPSIGIATVYRFMSLLSEEKIIEKHDFGDGKYRYEFSDNENHHDHMIDIETKQIIEFYDAKLEKLKIEIAKKHGYELLDHRLEMICRKIKKS